MDEFSWVEMQLPDLFRANQRLKSINGGTIQMPLMYSLARSISHHCRKSLSVSDHPYSAKKFPSAWTDPPQMQFYAIPALPLAL